MKKDLKKLEKLARFLAEIFMLKRNKREGWRLINVEPDSLADHLTIAAQIAYVLGEMEGLSGEKCAAIVLFHDNGEVRTIDQHKVSARYFDARQAELKAAKDQLQNLPTNIGKKIYQLIEQHEKRNTPEGIVARDADWLEVALQAKILVEHGYKFAQNWIDNVVKALETDSAQKILQEISTIDDFTNSWWQGLKKMTYKKLYK
ncbi:MAG: hypothetical protein A2731_02405 [Candidatus Buchananbacteria bacterium RIFCSPHIGHO2_01_FULL_39_8]|uniref:HD domain-containing protein n=1 Tax=Candidatus Buchananbacteria bacterium RIFCSPHIGHO2_01_FULL_39_8 TaxID=1797533 RepID=A0A1G1Y093_9BACT|nr:MAG: hypothetical protein A2731_02405 [Candidatus Buchananbacteria bacterium RIFCSPHIGHO2_01_FULL_39_8]